MITERMIERRERAKKLRARGMTYEEIGAELGVSGTMARHYVKGKRSANSRTGERENICNRVRPNYKIRCVRQAGHRGIHLVNDENGKLVYWE